MRVTPSAPEPPTSTSSACTGTRTRRQPQPGSLVVAIGLLLLHRRRKPVIEPKKRPFEKSKGLFFLKGQVQRRLQITTVPHALFSRSMYWAGVPAIDG